RQSGVVAPLAKRFAKAIGRIGLAGIRDEKRQMLAWRGIEHGLKLGPNRERQRRAGLLLLQRDHIFDAKITQVLVCASANMLAAELDHIAAPLRGVKQQRER